MKSINSENATMQYEEDKFYNLTETYGLSLCQNECSRLSDFCIERQDGQTTKVCKECREELGWL